MKIVVLGAAGRMGQMHARHLIKMGHEIRCFDYAPLPDDLLQYMSPLEEPRWVEWGDGVVIALPAKDHLWAIETAIKYDKHVFVEKPICTIEHLDETRKAVELAREKQLVVAVGYNLRFHPVVMSVHDEIATGMLKPMWGSFVLRQKPARPLAYFLEEWASHEVDLAMHLMGSEDIDGASLFRGDDEIRIAIQHGPWGASFIHADAYTEPFRRAFTIVDREGQARTWDIERNHVKPKDYQWELEDWICSLPGGHVRTPCLATGEDGLAVIELLARVMR